MVTATYRLPDEPIPSGMTRYAVDPMWPLLAVMLTGNVFGLAWFVFNGFALGSPTRAREWMLVALSVVGSGVLLVLLGFFENSGWLQGAELRYAALSLLVLKLCVAYSLYMTQQNCFEIWEHYGGNARNGLPVLFLLLVFGRAMLSSENLPGFLVSVLQ